MKKLTRFIWQTFARREPIDRIIDVKAVNDVKVGTSLQLVVREGGFDGKEIASLVIDAQTAARLGDFMIDAMDSVDSKRDEEKKQIKKTKEAGGMQHPTMQFRHSTSFGDFV